MLIPFTKMQGAGNDYVYLDLLKRPELLASPDFQSSLSGLARRLSDRHFGIGGDGLVLILPSTVADLKMRIFNADGSEAEMCGNAARCIGRYVFDNQIITNNHFTLETMGKIRHVSLDRETDSIVVDMGQSLGNPHAVFFVEELTDELVLGRGPEIECAPQYPHRTNVEFAVIQDRHNLRMRVWERGSGETLACGTGACATAIQSVESGHCDYPVHVHMTGGTLTINLLPNGHIMMAGPAEIVYQGEIEI